MRPSGASVSMVGFEEVESSVSSVLRRVSSPFRRRPWSANSPTSPNKAKLPKNIADPQTASLLLKSEEVDIELTNEKAV